MADGWFCKRCNMWPAPEQLNGDVPYVHTLCNTTCERRARIEASAISPSASVTAQPMTATVSTFTAPAGPDPVVEFVDPEKQALIAENAALRAAFAQIGEIVNRVSGTKVRG